MRKFRVIIFSKDSRMLLEGACVLFKARKNKNKCCWEKVLNTCFVTEFKYHYSNLADNPSA